MTLKLLIVEDAPDIAPVVTLSARLAWPGSHVAVAAPGREALQRFAEEQPDLVILNLGISPPDGFDVCRRIREVSWVPIVVLTDGIETLDKVRALGLGADACMAKPFDTLELLARLRAILRRVRSAPLPTTVERLTVGDLALDTDIHEVRVCGQVVRLTFTEYRLLEELARHAGSALTHRQLLERVWGPEYASASGFLKVYMRRLRRKLGDEAVAPRYIQSEWGIGYRLIPPADGPKGGSGPVAA